MAQSVFPGRPGLSHFGRQKQVEEEEQKVSAPARAWNHALSQARARRRRRWGVLFFWRLRLWTLAGTFPVPYFFIHCHP